jgi:hypothetical protein
LTPVADPYHRWLEDDRSAAAWVDGDKVTYGYLKIPFRDALKPHGETMEL